MFVLGIFMMTNPKTIAGDLLSLIICTLNWTGLICKNSLMSVNT